MAKKRTNSKKSRRPQSEKEEISEIAKKILTGDGKNPYYYGGIAIQNFDQLQDHLQDFSEHEAGWLADWIDYLGDNRTALKIREIPSEFKTIINERYIELKRSMKE